jgi:hypothetical protein
MNESKYIDRNKLTARLPVLNINDGDYLVSTDDVRKAIKIAAANTGDVVEVVRCKDCKHATFYSCKNDKCYKAILCDYDVATVDENFYCAYGERRKEDAEIL